MHSGLAAPGLVVTPGTAGIGTFPHNHPQSITLDMEIDMLSLGKWMICGAIALPVGFGIGFVLDAKLPQASAKVYRSEMPATVWAPVAMKPAEPASPPAREKPAPERAAPTPVAAPTPTEKPATPAPAAAPVAKPTPAPAKAPETVTAPEVAKPSLPRLGLDKGSITLEDDEVKIRTPYGSFSFSL